MKKEPTSRPAVTGPMMVTTGINAFRRAWTRMTVRSWSPLLRAVRMKSCRTASRTLARVSRVRNAAGPAARRSVGRIIRFTSHDGSGPHPLPQPMNGNHPSVTPNR